MKTTLRANHPHRNLLALGLVALAAVGALIFARGSADASSVQTTAHAAEVTWTKPTGPEMTPETAAKTALTATGNQGATTRSQAVTVRVVHGKFGPLRHVLEGAGAGPMHTGAARCLPDAPVDEPCNLAEVEHWEQIEREMNESPAYLVEMDAENSFSLPGDLVRRGQSVGGGEIETVILNAQNGFIRSREIGDRELELGGLGQIYAYEANIAPTGARAASSAKVVHIAVARRKGRIVGRLKGTNIAGKPVRLFNKGTGAKRPGEIGLLRKTITGPHGEFVVNSVMPIEYTIQVPGCKGGALRVKPGLTTHIVLSCTY